MKALKKHTYFTVIELMISVGIISLLFSMFTFLLRNQIRTVFIGEREVKSQHEIQVIMKRFFLDTKKINARLQIDEDGDITVAGEKYKNLMPSFIKVIDTSAEHAYGEELEFRYYSLSPLGVEHLVRYYMDPDNPTWLIREHSSDGKTDTVVVSKYVNDVYFRKGDDSKSFNVFVEVLIDKNVDKDIDEARDNFEMTLRVDNDFVIVANSVKK